MNPSVIAAVVGTVTLLLSLGGLIYPERVMGFLGLAVLNPSHAAAALGEVRATYGGLFLVMGAWTLAAATNPSAHRGTVVMLGLLWLGACAGRVVGIALDGNPGVFGWLTALFEAVMGGALLVAAQMQGPKAGSSGRPDRSGEVSPGGAHGLGES